MNYFDYDEEDEPLYKKDERTRWGLKGVNILGLYGQIKNFLQESNINPVPSRDKDEEIEQRGKKKDSVTN